MSDPCQYVITTLENHNSRLDKEAIILAQAEKGNDEFFEGARLALDPMITFGIKQIPEKKDEDGPGLAWDNFTLTITGFVNRSLTGNLARDTVANMMASATKKEWNGWYRRILIKDLRCGVSEKTINKAVEKDYAQYVIPVFDCQLAHDSAKHESKVAGKKLIEVKLDGVRVITIVYPDGRVDMFSRNGKELVNFPLIKKQIAAAFTDGEEPMVLDGEIMSSSFQDLMTQVRRKDNVQADDAVLNLFDILPLEHFEKGYWNYKQSHRSEMVQNWVAARHDLMPNVACLANELVDLDTDAGRLRFKEINEAAIIGGYEGIMLKDPDAVYECKRSFSWLKLKPYIEVSLTVVGFEEGKPGSKHVGRLGALVCEGVDDGKFIHVNVGSGYTDQLRDEIWANKEAVIGQIIEVRADALTKNQNSEDVYSLRFSRFRGFLPGEKL